MSVFAGILARTDGGVSAEAERDLLAGLRRSGDEVAVHRSGPLFLAKINVGALDNLALHESEGGAVTALAGDPIYDSGGPSRSGQLDALTPDLARDGVRALARCRGQFALAHHAPKSRSVVLATDFCGVRPLYYCLEPDRLIFSTGLHLLEGVRSLDLCMDSLGVTEQICFGFPLGDRTPYSNVRCLRTGEALSVGPSGAVLESYDAMDDVVESGVSLKDLAEQAWEEFRESARLRIGGRDEAVAFLSGGLDSRCIVGALTTLGVDVPCVNIRRPGKLDSQLARRFAKAMSVELLEHDVPEGERQYVSKGLALGRLREKGWLQESRALVFSGDGGSVGMGHVYMNAELVAGMRSGGLAGVAAQSLRGRGMPSRTAFRRPVHRRVVDALERSIEAELAALNGPAEAGRKYHIFLMQNDQRRHLHHHYEHLDRYRTEFAVPFFDTRFLRLILSVPVDQGLRHRFYYDWLEWFPDAVRAIPWQAYPGHLPCALPREDGDRLATSQWEWNRRKSFDDARDALGQAQARLFGRWLPRALGIRRERAALALVLHRLRLQNGRGLFNAVNEYQRYLARTGGRVSDWEARSSPLPRPGTQA